MILKIEDFVVINGYVEWHEIEQKFGKVEFKRFEKWMRGQTCAENGVYIYDLSNYLEERLKGIKDPYVGD